MDGGLSSEKLIKIIAASVGGFVVVIICSFLLWMVCWRSLGREVRRSKGVSEDLNPRGPAGTGRFQKGQVSNAMIRYLNALDNLGMTILEMLAHGLGLPDNFFTENFEEKEATMIRVNRYPPCPLPEKCLGLGSHSDPHTLTILLQDDVGGLQVLTSDNKWIGIRPVQNSFIINIGDTLEAWTNGKLRSVVHRAVLNKEKNRLSAAYFMSPRNSALIDCPLVLMDAKTNPRKYVPFTWGNFRKQLLVQKRVVGKTALERYLISK
ncbi:hypothetical protein FF2_037316 [Malus domestica]